MIGAAAARHRRRQRRPARGSARIGQRGEPASDHFQRCRRAVLHGRAWSRRAPGTNGPENRASAAAAIGNLRPLPTARIRCGAGHRPGLSARRGPAALPSHPPRRPRARSVPEAPRAASTPPVPSGPIIRSPRGGRIYIRGARLPRVSPCATKPCMTAVIPGVRLGISLLIATVAMRACGSWWSFMPAVRPSSAPGGAESPLTYSRHNAGFRAGLTC